MKDKRIITIDNFIYQVKIKDRIPFIYKIAIQRIVRIDSEQICIVFTETDTDYKTIDSKCNYTYRGENWVEKDRKEIINWRVVYNESDYFLSEEEANKRVEVLNKKEKSIIEKEIENLIELKSKL